MIKTHFIFELMNVETDNETRNCQNMPSKNQVRVSLLDMFLIKTFFTSKFFSFVRV